MDALADDLRYAAGRNQIAPLFAPLVDLATGAVAGFQAESWWAHASRGPLGPDVVGPLAEAVGLAPALDRWVLEQVCAAVAGWGGEAVDALAVVAVPVAAATLGTPGLADHARAAADLSGLPPDRLALAAPPGAALSPALADDLQRTGLGLWTADLTRPTGAPLAAFRIAADALDADVLGLARRRGLPVVATGVASAAALAAAREAGAAFACGPYVGAAVPADEARALLAAPPVSVAG